MKNMHHHCGNPYISSSGPFRSQRSEFDLPLNVVLKFSGFSSLGDGKGVGPGRWICALFEVTLKSIGLLESCNSSSLIGCVVILLLQGTADVLGWLLKAWPRVLTCLWSIALIGLDERLGDQADRLSTRTIMTSLVSTCAFAAATFF